MTLSAKLVRPRRAAGLLGLAALLLPLPGCQSVTGAPNVSQVRVIDASPDAGGLDIYEGGSILAYNLGLGTVTSYVQISPGNYGVVADAAGTHTQLVGAVGTFLINSNYTVLIGSSSATLQEQILKDQNTPAPARQISLRVIDQSTRAGAVDVYLIPTGSTITQVKPVLVNVPFGQNTGYFNMVAGTYTIAVLPTGTVPTASGTTSFTGSSVVYAGGSARTLVLIDQPLATTPGLSVITLADYDSPNATS